jgi:hypothetical protein
MAHHNAAFQLDTKRDQDRPGPKRLRLKREGAVLSTTLNAANSLVRVRGPERLLFFPRVIALLAALIRLLSLLTRRSLPLIILRMIALLLLGALQLLFFLPVHWFLLSASDVTFVGDVPIVWPAPGSEDTELGILMDRRWVMERRKFTRQFKLEAVRLIKDRGVSYALKPQVHAQSGVKTNIRV